MRRIVIAAFAMTVLAACQPADTALSDEDVAAINSLKSSYVQAVVTGDADAVAATYAEDATEMPPDLPARQGREAIRAANGTPVPDLILTAVELDGRDGLAFERGTWSVTTTVADTTVAATGKYLTVFRKQVDGSWLIANGIWNSDAPMPQPE